MSELRGHRLVGRRAALIAIGIVACWLGPSASSASASSIYERSAGIVREYVYAGSPGEHNHVTVREVGSNFDFIESSSGVTISGVYSYCTQVSPVEVTCPRTFTDGNPMDVDAELHDGFDTIDMRTTRPALIKGGPAADILSGGSANDSILGNGDDPSAGADGNDWIDGRGGADAMVGGDGAGDTVSYESRSTAVNVSIDGIANDGGSGEGDNVGTDIEVIRGTSAADTLTGSSSDNTLWGLGGADTIAGLGGEDRFYGGASDDRINGGDGNDTISGETGFDTLDGGADDDTIDGGADDDALTGGAGADHMAGGDSVDDGGGPGFDTVDYSTSTAPVTVNVGDDQPYDGAAGEGDNAHSDIERVFGGSGDDHLSLGRPPSLRPRGELWGRGGNDTLIGGDNNDRLEGQDGNDTLDGSYAADLISGGAGVDTLDYSWHWSTDIGGAVGSSSTPNGVADDGNYQIDADWDGNGFLDDVGADVENVIGSAGPDFLVGTIGPNLLQGFGDSDILHGDAGGDSLDGGTGADTLDGGADVDTATYASRSAPLRVSLDDLPNDGEVGEGDNAMSTVEDVRGGAGADTLLGSGTPNRLIGGPGDDTLNGRLGADTLDGQSGVDTITYSDRTTPVAVTIDGKRNDGADPNGDGKSTTAEEGDMDRGVENTSGGDGSDILRAPLANAVVNVLRGFDGDDTLKTREGTATIDSLLCGPGAGDRFAKDPSDTQGACEVSLP